MPFLQTDQGRCVREATAAVLPGGDSLPSTPAQPPEPDVARTVYGWLARLVPDPDDAERLLVEVLRRSRSAPPACLRSASEATLLQFLTVQSVLRLRGVL